MLIRDIFSGIQVILGVQDIVGHESFTTPITIQDKPFTPSKDMLVYVVWGGSDIIPLKVTVV
jgi:hypothetical protein